MRLERPNVVYLMLDAVSDRQFYRRLPKSSQVLKTIHRPGNHRLFELYRYHSVGFSSDNNTKAAYIGEIYPSRPNQLPIWAHYRDRGYVTARVETGCDDWAELYLGGKYKSQEYSVGNRKGHEGSGEVLRTVDDSLAAFLESMRDSGELNDTVLIIATDHGLHMGLSFALLQNGRIEHQSPFLVMSVPEWLHECSEKYQTDHGSEKVSPFAANEQRLVTPFETHHTFRVLADWSEFETDSWKRSLFAAQRAGRTCEEAGIGASFCMCKIPATS
ncbi:hypothetical protein GGI17_004359 [Coemansia sp. S146]|nr:hypothetical protein GGI17_004359 [Coemansia sp. S146]